MVPKKTERKEAVRLRLLGHSLNEIAARLGISKSSASVWLSDVKLSKKAQSTISRKSLLGRQRSAEKHRAQTRAHLDVSASVANSTVAEVNLNKKVSQVICALIYRCEGEKSKSDRALTFANSDPGLVATYLNLLRTGFDVNEHKFRVCLHLHDYHNEKTQIRIWAKITGIPSAQFLKTYRKPHTGKRTREGYAGCASIRYYDTRLARQLNALGRAAIQKYGA